MMTGQPGCIKLIHMIAMTSRRGPREVPRLTSSTLGEVVVFVIANSHGITNLLGSLVVGFKFQQEGAMAMRWAATIAKPAVELVKTCVGFHSGARPRAISSQCALLRASGTEFSTASSRSRLSDGNTRCIQGGIGASL